jgi:NAD(P)-dependent dehydrogenase (short-subunit alcohol dehydrogenase family)
MRSVLITGTSSGIGLATVVALATRGWRVFATMRDLNKRGYPEGYDDPRSRLASRYPATPRPDRKRL